MGKVIYYFSGTGNSLWIAKNIARKIGAELIPMASEISKETVVCEAETMGIVFPLQDFKAPKAVEKFTEKLADIGNKYIFAVCTYGIKPSNSLKKLDKILRKRGGTINSGFAVKMPHNGIGSKRVTQKEIESCIEGWKMRSDDICRKINGKQEAKLESSIPLFKYFNISSGRNMGTLIKFLLFLIRFGTGGLAFQADKKCVGCRTCEKVCPSANITVDSGKPVWGNRCISCFACINWCSSHAISMGGNMFELNPYHHPEISVEDIMVRK